MKKYKINVNGNSYEVEIELIDAASVQASAPAAESAPAIESAPAGSQTVNAPMPGTILAVNVTPNQAVKKGDVLFVLEAMKMENEIMAPADGVVSAVSVAKGASVESGSVLCTIA